MLNRMPILILRPPYNNMQKEHEIIYFDYSGLW